MFHFFATLLFLLRRGQEGGNFEFFPPVNPSIEKEEFTTLERGGRAGISPVWELPNRAVNDSSYLIKPANIP